MIFEARNLKTVALPPVSLSVSPGECLSVRGPSGSGKTLLLRALADLDEADGEIFLDQNERHTMSGPRWRKKVRYLAAEPGFWAETVADHIDPASTIAALLAGMGMSDDCFSWSVDRLSTGEKQRVGLALGLADNPPVILADEPTSALDAEAATLVEELLQKKLAGGSAIILVSHDPELIDRLAQRHLAIEGGKLVEAT